MHTIVYSSQISSKEPIDHLLKNITSVAQKNNYKQEITGVLFFHNNRFLQIIEGPKDELQQLMLKLKKDPRHRHIEILIDEAIENRSFEEWDMDSFNLDSENNFNIENLKEIRDLYKKNFKMNSEVMIKLFKKLINEI